MVGLRKQRSNMVQKSVRKAWSSVQFKMVTFSGPISVHRKLSQVKFGITIIGTFEAILIFLMCVALSECALQRAVVYYHNNISVPSPNLSKVSFWPRGQSLHYGSIHIQGCLKLKKVKAQILLNFDRNHLKQFGTGKKLLKYSGKIYVLNIF